MAERRKATGSGEDSLSRHILPNSGTMVGVCTTLIGLVKIAEASPEQLAAWSKFPKLDEGALKIVEAQRARAREILDYYKIHYETSRLTKSP